MTMNGFFRLMIKADGTYLIVYPPTDGGQPCQPSEVLQYLDTYQIPYDKIAIYNLMKTFNEKKELKITSSNVSRLDETMVIEFTENFLSVTGRFYPEVEGGKKLEKSDIIWLLNNRGVKFGIKEDVIEDFLEHRMYCTTYTLAEALAPVEGSDAEITYNFNTDLSKKPKMNEDGSVDFHQLDNLSKVTADQILATLKPAVYGKPGMDVLGRQIPPKKVNVLFLKQSKNTRLSDDGLQLYCNINGHAVLTDKQVFVSDTYEIPGNVDVATGDIDYTGNVKITGNVNSGYKVHAEGDVIVDGIVEGAEIIAGGQIVLKRGIQGMNKGVLRAGGNIVAKFIESAEVVAGGFIQTESIMHSKVTSGAEIIVKGKKGFITGGVIKASKFIEAKTMGSVMGTQTIIEVGENMVLIEEERTLLNEKRVIKENLEKAEKVIFYLSKKIKDREQLPPERIVQFQQLSVSISEYKKRLAEIEDRLTDIEAMLNSASKGYINVDDVIYPGCKVTVANVTTYIKAETKHCCLIRDGADVRVTAYK